MGNNTERYKKLKQSDRMEYLAIFSIYEGRENTYTKIVFILFGIKIFMVGLFDIIAVKIIKELGIPLSEIINIGMGEFFLGLLFIGVLMFVEFVMLHLLIVNKKKGNKVLEEFLSERKV